MSNPEIRAFVKMAAETLNWPEPIYEYGSRIWPGQKKVADYRSFFADKQYIGFDVLHGDGVDAISNVIYPKESPGSAGSIICTCTLEHVLRPWDAIAAMKRVLKPGGTMLVIVPFAFPLHDYPSDYWRMTPACLEHYMRSDYSWPLLRVIAAQGTNDSPENIIAIGTARQNTFCFDAGVNRWLHRWDNWNRTRRAYRTVHHWMYARKVAIRSIVGRMTRWSIKS